ncbi:lycopene cyclase family protein [Actinosynnema sp. NPDC047251]|nr:lycopene cyclase family protein [Saccharothrix espanaensis]
MIVIAGGGMSGLSLAGHLSRWPVTVVDDGHADLEGLAWASWSDRPGLLDAAVSRTFDRVRVHAGGRTWVLDLGCYRYRVVLGPDLARVVRVVRVVRELAPGCRYRRGHVDLVEDGRIVVDGEAFPARWVFDSVGGPLPDPDGRLAFLGWHVRTDRPAFDPDVPTLFDFRTRQLGASFVYVLPVDPHHALVEHTSFTSGPVDDTARREALREYLDDVIGTDGHVVEREESADLPLISRPAPRRRGNVLAIGARGGLVKASTGYSYQRVQRDSAAIARSLRRHGHPFDLRPPPTRFRLYDGALLDVVAAEPARLEQAFAALFRHATAEPALRFLDERTSLIDEVRLFATMPAAAYLSAVRRRLSRATG